MSTEQIVFSGKFEDCEVEIDSVKNLVSESEKSLLSFAKNIEISYNSIVEQINEGKLIDNYYNSFFVSASYVSAFTKRQLERRVKDFSTKNILARKITKTSRGYSPAVEFKSTEDFLSFVSEVKNDEIVLISNKCKIITTKVASTVKAMLSKDKMLIVDKTRKQPISFEYVLIGKDNLLDNINLYVDISSISKNIFVDYIEMLEKSDEKLAENYNIDFNKANIMLQKMKFGNFDIDKKVTSGVNLNDIMSFSNQFIPADKNSEFLYALSLSLSYRDSVSQILNVYSKNHFLPESIISNVEKTINNSAEFNSDFFARNGTTISSVFYFAKRIGEFLFKQQESFIFSSYLEELDKLPEINSTEKCVELISSEKTLNFCQFRIVSESENEMSLRVQFNISRKIELNISGNKKVFSTNKQDQFKEQDVKVIKGGQKFSNLKKEDFNSKSKYNGSHQMYKLVDLDIDNMCFYIKDDNSNDIKIELTKGN